MVDMSHKLVNYILAQDKKNKKDKNKKNKGGDKKKDDSDDDKKKKDKKEKKEKKEKKAKKEKKSKKDKKEDAGDEENDYLKALETKKDDGFGSNSDDDNDEVASEAGVDDEGAMGKTFPLLKY